MASISEIAEQFYAVFRRLGLTPSEVMLWVRREA